MVISRALQRAVVIAVAVLSSVVGSGVLAQPNGGPPQLPPDLLGQDQPLGPQQLQTLRQYISYFTQRLSAGSPDTVASARDRLLSPLNRPDVPQAFRAGYTGQFVAELGDDYSELGDPARINVMIVTRWLAGGEALPLIEQGLRDPNPGVRYWAAKAAAEIANRSADAGGFSQPQQEQLLQVLGERIGAEDSNWALAQLLRGLSRLRVPAAADMLLQALNERVAFHAQNPTASYQPEREALQTLYQDLVTRQRLEGVPAAQLVQVARVALRLMAVAAQQAQQAGPQLAEAERQDKAAIIGLTNTILSWAVPLPSVAGQTAQLPTGLEGAIARGTWDAILAAVQQYRQILANSVPGLTEQDLQVPSPQQ